jgi:orotate phosphoribosyltransferase
MVLDRARAALQPFVRRGEFTLRSGRKSDLYVDVKSGLLGPHAVHIYDAIQEMILLWCDGARLDFGKLVFVGYGYGGAILAGGLSARFGWDTAVLRSERKEHGLKGKLIGCQITKDKYPVIIEDVVTTGGSVNEAIELLIETIGEENFAGVKTAVTVVDRRQPDDPEAVDFGDMRIMRVADEDLLRGTS